MTNLGGLNSKNRKSFFYEHVPSFWEPVYVTATDKENCRPIVTNIVSDIHNMEIDARSNKDNNDEFISDTYSEISVYDSSIEYSDI